MATSTDFQNEAAGISTFAGKTTNTMQPPQEPCPSMTEPPAENSRVHQSPDEAALCWSTDLGHLLEDDEQEEHDPDPPQDQPEVQEVKQGAAADDQEAGGQEQKEDRALPPDPDSNLMMGVANQDEAGESGGSVPSPVVTETEQRNTEMAARGRRPDGCFKPGTAVEEASLQKVGGPSDPPTFAAVSASRPTSSGDGGDVTCCDLLSLRSDSVSLASEFNVFGRSEEDDTRSVTTSSVMSLFHRVSLDPLEKEWLKSCAVGNVATQRRLLAQEPGLVLKKDFITGFTALHWAARHGREDAVDMMLHSGADVNVRSMLKPTSEITTGRRPFSTGAAAPTSSRNPSLSQAGGVFAVSGRSVTLCRPSCCLALAVRDSSTWSSGRRLSPPPTTPWTSMFKVDRPA
ncbi:ankyrin repeat domain-containing protein SOWAHC isoform X3 [Astatotilapia calliptera]|uniref:ankyrin repeat domain-containing protein SOWAHC isoform X3 n=1 Tax=Astatotilapia calliptera TaxID=8154 RepID=UPI000E42AC1F|nr:ankyrin repeat domain-containing protein SOWAHC-like isoform X3 [Astatotilapia calliptera]